MFTVCHRKIWRLCLENPIWVKRWHRNVNETFFKKVQIVCSLKWSSSFRAISHNSANHRGWHFWLMPAEWCQFLARISAVWYVRMWITSSTEFQLFWGHSGLTFWTQGYRRPTGLSIFWFTLCNFYPPPFQVLLKSLLSSCIPVCVIYIGLQGAGPELGNTPKLVAPAAPLLFCVCVVM